MHTQFSSFDEDKNTIFVLFANPKSLSISTFSHKVFIFLAFTPHFIYIIICKLKSQSYFQIFSYILIFCINLFVWVELIPLFHSASRLFNNNKNKDKRTNHSLGVKI